MAEHSATDMECEVLEDIKEPPSYKVLMHDDNVTTMQFVEDILQRVFQKNPEEAHALMMRVHETGIGLCGIYTREVAEAKIARVGREAWQAGFPLKCTMEEA